MEMEELFIEESGSPTDRRCGEVFFTTKKKILFHCLMCNNKCYGFEKFIQHLSACHFPCLDDFDDFDNDDVEFNNTFDPTDTNEEVEEFLEIKREDDLSDLEEKTSSETCDFNDSEVISEMETLSQSDKKKSLKKVSTAVTRPAKIDEILGEDLTTPIPEIRFVRARSSFQTTNEEYKYKCPVCSASFKENHNMRYHFLRHTNKKTHKCPECEKLFYTKSEVNIHLRCHKKERPYLCNECGAAYISNSHLKIHLKKHRNQKDFKCDVCSKAFLTSTLLKSHMTKHSTERPFKCDLCKKKFSNIKSLKTHIKIHENKREYKCKICGSAFNQRPGLFSHMKNVHKTL